MNGSFAVDCAGRRAGDERQRSRAAVRNAAAGTGAATGGHPRSLRADARQWPSRHRRATERPAAGHRGTGASFGHRSRSRGVVGSRRPDGHASHQGHRAAHRAANCRSRGGAGRATGQRRRLAPFVRIDHGDAPAIGGRARPARRRHDEPALRRRRARARAAAGHRRPERGVGAAGDARASGGRPLRVRRQHLRASRARDARVAGADAPRRRRRVARAPLSSGQCGADLRRRHRSEGRRRVGAGGVRTLGPARDSRCRRHP